MKKNETGRIVLLVLLSIGGLLVSISGLALGFNVFKQWNKWIKRRYR